MNHLKEKRALLYGIGSAVAVVLILFLALSQQLIGRYEAIRGATIHDRNGIPIRYANTQDGQRPLYLDAYPQRIKELVVRKEDRFFYYHLGINPVSIVRSLFQEWRSGSPSGSSTLTQQLVKVLLGHESSRNAINKASEIFYAFALEARMSKDEILTMYLNSVFLGNRTRGFAQASYAYYQKSVEELSDDEIVRLLAALSRPTSHNPLQTSNDDVAQTLSDVLNVDIASTSPALVGKLSTAFELISLGIECESSCTTTIDAKVTEDLRSILADTIEGSARFGATHGGIVVINIRDNELLAIIGSPYPDRLSDEYQINMAIRPRPIGSTVKPFIYGKAFELGTRPYSLVVDQEYRYPVGTGFPIYPKNFDGKYHGTVTLHEALSNSLNVPSVKLLEFIGLDRFYDFFSNDLSFEPVSPLPSYAYGIALGGLEMDLLTLTHYFTLFPNQGTLKDLMIGGENAVLDVPQSHTSGSKQILDKEYTQLVTKILSDRDSGVEQFGLRSNLNLDYGEYAVKTGTSRDFHDSWTIGYTPDFVVGVWIGNAENRPMTNLSGLIGAGQVWKRAMEYMLASPYRTDRRFSFDDVVPHEQDGVTVYGLAGDDAEAARNLLLRDTLIDAPHDGDVILLTEDTSIPLISDHTGVQWHVNNTFIGSGETIWRPTSLGIYEIEARDNKKSEMIHIEVIGNESFIPR